jgi:hypothetical protein
MWLWSNSGDVVSSKFDPARFSVHGGPLFFGDELSAEVADRRDVSSALPTNSPLQPEHGPYVGRDQVDGLPLHHPFQCRTRVGTPGLQGWGQRKDRRLGLGRFHGRQLRVEQNGRSARHHVPLLIIFFSLFSRHCYRPVLDTAHTSRSDTRRVRPTRSNHGPSRPHCSAHFSFLSSSLYPIDVVSCSRTAFISTKLLQRGICVRHHLSYYPPLYVLIFSLFNHHHRCPRGNLQYRS